MGLISPWLRLDFPLPTPLLLSQEGRIHLCTKRNEALPICERNAREHFMDSWRSQKSFSHCCSFTLKRAITHLPSCASKPSTLGSQNPRKSYQSFQNCLEINVTINLLVICVWAIWCIIALLNVLQLTNPSSTERAVAYISLSLFLLRFMVPAHCPLLNASINFSVTFFSQLTAL